MKGDNKREEKREREGRISVPPDVLSNANDCLWKKRARKSERKKRGWIRISGSVNFFKFRRRAKNKK